MIKLGMPFFGGGDKDKPSQKSVAGAGDSAAKDIIKLACQNRRSVEVFAPDDKGSYSSFFVACKEDVPAFYLDSLIPTPGQMVLRPGELFAIIFFLHSIQYRLTASFDGLEKLDGFESLRFTEPIRLENQQKRDHYRVEPSLGRPVEVETIAPNGVRERATALDISVSGIRYRTSSLKPDRRVFLNVRIPGQSQLIENIELEVLERGRIDITGKGRPLDKPYFARGRFVGLGIKDSNAISKYVADRQREINGLFA